MQKELWILIVEDTPADVRAIADALRKGGLSFRFTEVDNRRDFLMELQKSPDVILSDHGFPAFDGYTALVTAKQQQPDIPFIFVTGALGEEVVIEAFEKGADDYVLKTRLDTLVPAVARAITASEEKRKRAEANNERRKIIFELVGLLQKLKTLRGLLPICTSCKKVRNTKGQWNTVEDFLAHHLDVTFTHGFCPDCADKLYPGYGHSENVKGE